jgi:hypothetical protein
MRARAGRARWVRRLAFLAGLGAAVLACRRLAREQAAAESAERSWSVQLHLHGSSSEGMGSIDSHSYEARDVGCDVLWWSDHDFRVLTYEHASRYGFEGWQEPLDRGEPWKARLEKHLGDTKGLTPSSKPGSSFAFVSEPRREGEHSLRARWSAPGADFAPVSLPFVAARLLERRSLASGVTLRLAVWPEELGPDARLFVSVELSEHAPRGGLELGQDSLRYVLTNDEHEERRAGRTLEIPLPYRTGEWNELVLPISADAVRGFPDSPGEDNVLYGVVLGLEARNGASAAAYLDDLRIDQERSGAPLFARQAALIDEVARLYPELCELQGLEVSYGSRHLNLFALETPLPDYDAIAATVPADPEHPGCIDDVAFKNAIADHLVERTHAAGGLVSLNHMFGVNLEGHRKARTNEEQLDILLRTRACGANLIEVGYRDRAGASLADHLWVWDRAALSGLRLVGTGVSDSHGGSAERWRGRPNNFVSWILAPTPGKADLIEGLRAGRVFFGDLELFDGALDLATDGGARMGSVVLTDRDEVEVEARVQGLTRAAELAWIESGELSATVPLAAGDARVPRRVRLPATGPALVRFELRDARGQAFALSNPIHFLREVPEGGLAAPTVALDLGGVRGTRARELRITGFAPARAGQDEPLRIDVESEGGELDLELARAPRGITLEGLSGDVVPDGPRVRLRNLGGTGSLVVRE